MAKKSASYNPAQQAAANAGASQTVIDKLATPAATPATSATASNVAQAAAISSGAPQSAINNVATPVVTPQIPSVPQTPTMPQMPTTIQAPLPPAMQPVVVPGHTPIQGAQIPLPSGAPSIPSQGFIASNPAQLAAINAGITDPGVLEQLAGDQTTAPEPPANAGADWLADFLANQQPVVMPTGGGGGGGGGSASVGIQVPVVPGTQTESTEGTETESTEGTEGTSGAPSGEVVVPIMTEQNQSLAQLNALTFEYDPSTDKDLAMQMANVENAIIQSMIGRGGLYSSVAQSAVSAKMMDLSIEYEKIAYDKYVSNRNWLMSMAQFEQDRLNTAWTQNFQTAQFNAQLEQNRFENEMAAAQFQFQIEKEEFDRKMRIAAANRAAASLALQKQQAALHAQQQQQQAAIVNALYTNKIEQNKFNEYAAQWQKEGKASKEVAAYFSAYGIYAGASYNDAISQKILTKKEKLIKQDAYKISSIASELGQAEIAVSYLDTYVQPSYAQVQGTSELNSSLDMKANYISTLNYLTDMASEKGVNNAIAAAQTQRNKIVASSGEYYYTELLNNLYKMKQTGLKQTGSASGW